LTIAPKNEPEPWAVRAWKWFDAWLALMGAAALFVALVLFQFELVEAKKLASVFGVFLIAMMTVIMSLQKAVQRSDRRLHKALDEVDGGVHRDHLQTRTDLAEVRKAVDETRQEVRDHLANLRHQLGLDLFTLEGCVNDLSSRLSRVPDQGQVVIRHLGLDMSHAWEKIERLLKEHPQIGRLDYDVLMLSPDLAGIAPVPDAVKDWANKAEAGLAAIRDGFSILADRMRSEHRSVRLCVRQYKSVPTVHGIAIIEPKQTAVHYVSFCRWEQGRYRWGGEEYVRIDGAEGNVNPVLRDKAVIFDGQFDELSRIAGSCVFEGVAGV
jgi:hypothetical protein